VIGDRLNRPVGYPSAPRRIGIAGSQSRMLNDGDAVVFLLVNMVAVPAMDRPLCRLAPNLRELRGEEKGSCSFFTLCPWWKPSMVSPHWTDVERNSLLLTVKARFVFVKRCEHMPKPDGAGFVVVALHDDQLDFFVASKRRRRDSGCP
jgi:hypothetical protein